MKRAQNLRPPRARSGKSAVRRLFVEKRPGYDVERQRVFHDLKHNLGLDGLKSLRLLVRYDVAGITDEEFAVARRRVFSEPPLDRVFDERISAEKGAIAFAVEYLPGQYDQRADSAGQCIQILTRKQRPLVATAKVT